MSIDKNFVRITKKLPSPAAVYDLDKISQNIDDLRKNLQNIEIFYAMKANPHKRIIEYLYKKRVGFEIASTSELEQLLSQGVAPQDIMCLHPIKSVDFIKKMKKAGVDILAVDCIEELYKISKFFPGARVVVRITVTNKGSRWNLSEKYGIEASSVLDLFIKAKKLGLKPFGLTFHVGSQCENLDNWSSALRACRDIWLQAKTLGIDLTLLSLGGGLPATYDAYQPQIRKIFKHLVGELQGYFNFDENIKITIEPGRAIVAESAILITEVFGVANRKGSNWAYIDVGIMNYLHEGFELQENFYPVEAVNNRRKKIIYQIGGPSCMTLDTPFKDIKLPLLNVGDRLYVKSVGAYSETCSSPFNGFFPPKVFFLQDLVG